MKVELGTKSVKNLLLYNMGTMDLLLILWQTVTILGPYLSKCLYSIFFGQFCQWLQPIYYYQTFEIEAFSEMFNCYFRELVH